VNVVALSDIYATRREASAFLRTSENQLRRWERRGVGPAVVRLSARKAIYPWESLRAFLDKDMKGDR
jgi:hypothetical protein